MTSLGSVWLWVWCSLLSLPLAVTFFFHLCSSLTHFPKILFQSLMSQRSPRVTELVKHRFPLPVVAWPKPTLPSLKILFFFFLQCCVGLLHKTAQGSHNFTYILSFPRLPPLPHSVPLCHHRLGSLLYTTASHQLSILHPRVCLLMLLSPFIPLSPSPTVPTDPFSSSASAFLQHYLLKGAMLAEIFEVFCLRRYFKKSIYFLRQHIHSILLCEYFKTPPSALCGMWCLSSPGGDQTCSLCIGIAES